MRLLDHISITVRDIGTAKRFYKAVMSALGAAVAYERDDAIGFGERNRPNDDLHTYLSVFQSDRAAPDPRRYHPGYYAAFLLDPEGNKIEAVHHGGD